jgi:hypothetical protein
MHDHNLFHQFPLTGEKEISIGRVPVPYHIYDGQGILIGGTTDLASIEAILQNEALFPIQTQSGKAVMSVWVVDFTEASLGSHNELQFSILVAHTPQSPIEDHPLALLKALYINPDARMFCYGLWNDTETAVAYNRELLGLDANLNQGKIELNHGQPSTFSYKDESGDLIFEGEVSLASQTPFNVGWQMLRLFGLRPTLRSFSQPYIEAKVVNPRGKVIPINADASSFLASDTPIVQLFDPAADSLRFGETSKNNFQFQPHFIEQFSPFRFVYLEPESAS